MPLSYSSLPRSPGVYSFKDSRNQVLYIGKAKSLRDRVASYFSPNLLLPAKTRVLVNRIRTIDYQEVESEIDALILEANLIRRFQPKYNWEFKDDKSYPRIEITIKDKVPQVHLVRRNEQPGNLYFGPYPLGSEVSKMLVFLRRIFPFVSQNHRGGKPCLRSHLGLCPCPAVFGSQSARYKYRRDLYRLIAFLCGNRDKVQKQLEKEMLRAATNQDFGKAGEIKEKLERLAWITASRTSAFEYELNPTLLVERRELELADLAKLVGLENIGRIECYDISNISGKLATGSLVVFKRGVADKSQYRRFRIRFGSKPDDAEMIREVIRRRFTHKNGWEKPSLIVVDGGAAQLSAAKEVVHSLVLSVPVIALAKREEEIYLDTNIKIKLPSASPALKLLQRLRDEAHRFSRKYHFLLRSKSLLT